MLGCEKQTIQTAKQRLRDLSHDGKVAYSVDRREGNPRGVDTLYHPNHIRLAKRLNVLFPIFAHAHLSMG